ncbi:MAG: prepilin-type N-terminal cleavage/methylation domain-containing protein [Planctomycetes bacterium]|nr:prepilin-type N-terminal cleavage/methylation domain-containing protein [Planctomycetota bacterium]
MRTGNAQRGFTLIEILVAVFVTAILMLALGETLMATIRARGEVQSLNESTEAGPRILSLIERDLQGLWHQNVKLNKVLVGRNLDIAGTDADRIDFLTTTDAVGMVLDNTNQPRRPTICEVGYWLRENRAIPGLLELWRREDPLVDDNLVSGGTFQLVHDRVRSFNISYYETVGYEAEEMLDWDSSRNDALPRRIKIEFTVERRLASRNEVSGAEVDDFEGVQKKYVRHIVLDRRYPEILKAGVAVLPMFPPEPEEAAAGGGGAGGPGAGGPGAGGRGPGGQGGVPGQRGGPGDIRQQVGSGRGGQGGNMQPPPGMNFGDLLRGIGGQGAGGFPGGGFPGGGGRGGGAGSGGRR